LRGAAEPRIDERLRGRLDVVEEIERPWSKELWLHKHVRRGRMAFSLLRPQPAWVTDCASAKYASTVECLASRWQPDLVQIEYHVMGQYVAALRNCAAPRVLTEHEPGNRAALSLDAHASIGRLLNQREKQAWQRYEPAVLRQVQAVVVFTEHDREAVQALAPATPVMSIPLGAELPQNPMDPLGSLPHSILFFGNFIHPPNVDAAWRTVQSIFPQLQARFPDLQLYIVGDKPPIELLRHRNPNIHVTGRVPELAPYLNRASIVIAPLRLGGGMRVKVLETLAAGKAMVASPRALEGLKLVHREAVWIAETDVEFCSGISDLLHDESKRVAAGRAARRWACSNLGWEKAIAAYEALYDALLESVSERAKRVFPRQEYRRDEIPLN
jgi:glycosyltransferase involved in cell wall biosynthesis